MAGDVPLPFMGRATDKGRIRIPNRISERGEKKQKGLRVAEKGAKEGAVVTCNVYAMGPGAASPLLMSGPA